MADFWAELAGAVCVVDDVVVDVDHSQHLLSLQLKVGVNLKVPAVLSRVTHGAAQEMDALGVEELEL